MLGLVGDMQTIQLLIKQIPALQVIIPLVASLINIFLIKYHLGNLITRITAIILVTFSIIVINSDSLPIYYYFGNWVAPIGISYKLYYTNAWLIGFINIILLLFSFCGKDIIRKQILNSIDTKYKDLFYSIILLLHMGVSGILLTYDLFHLYVALEIMSLSSCVLISQGKKAAKAAIDYLIISSIGASFILLSIGFILYFIGVLSIQHIGELYPLLVHNKAFSIAIAFFLVGSLLKVALFPVNLGVISIYRYCNPVILAYLAPVVSVAGFYIFYLMTYHIFSSHCMKEYQGIYALMLLCSILSMGVFTFASNVATTFRSLLIASSATQVGYMVLTFLFPESICTTILVPYLIADGLSKFALFLLLTDTDENLASLNGIARRYPLMGAGLTIILISSCNMPLTIGFINKVNLLSQLVTNGHIVAFIFVSLFSILSLVYHFKLLSLIYKSTKAVVKIERGTQQSIVIIAMLLTSILFM